MAGRGSGLDYVDRTRTRETSNGEFDSSARQDPAKALVEQELSLSDYRRDSSVKSALPHDSSFGSQGFDLVDEDSTGRENLERKSDRSEPHLGTEWKPAETEQIPCSFGCEKVAQEIQEKIRGEIRRIAPKQGVSLGPYRGQDTEWAYHDVVICNGRVFDAFSGSDGVALNDYKKLWDYADVIRFDPKED